MTDNEIKALSRKIAEELYGHFGDDKGTKLMAAECEDVIRIILRDHDITASSSGTLAKVGNEVIDGMQEGIRLQAVGTMQKSARPKEEGGKV